MPKRKRDYESTNDDGTPLDYRRQRQIVHTFEDSVKQLARSFKVAKGFERQKLGRRKKQIANEKGDGEHTNDLQRIDAEVAALKILDPTVAAENYLAKSLLKVKAIATSSEVLPEPVRKSWSAKAAATQTDPATLNVTARICNSKSVKEAFPIIWAGITRELGVEIDEAVGPGKTKKKSRLRAKDFADLQGNEDREEDRDEDEVELKSTGKKSSHKGEPGKTRVDSSAEASDDEFMEFKGRLASSSDDGSEDGDAGDVTDLERQLEAEGVSRRTTGTTKPAYDLAADLSLSDDQSDDGASTPELRKTATAPRTSAFLPSLSMGGYISGSGSDPDDDDEVEAAPRKNRRGQRARQQIWEKKYGTRAKHLAVQDQKKGWDRKRGAVEGRERGKKGHATPRGGKQGGATRSDTATGANAFAVQKPSKRDDAGALHPSWQAAKRAKEMKSAQVAFQGKKISFD